MGYKVTENWSGTFANIVVSDEAKNNSSGRKIFLVTATGGTTLTRSNCYGATDDDTGLSVPLIGAAFDGVRLDLRCKTVDPKIVNVGTALVTCEFSVGQFKKPEDDPLDEPPTVSIGQSDSNEDTDRDVDGLVIQNVVGAPMPGAKLNYNLETYTISKNIDFIPIELNREYRNTVNDADFTLLGITVKKGYARVVSILPSKPFKNDDEYVTANLIMEIWDDNQPEHPWQFRLLNQGSEAYGSVSSHEAVKGRICHDPSGDLPAGDVKLDIEGKPIESGYAVRLEKGAPLATSFGTAPEAADIIAAMPIAPDTSVAGAVYLRNRKCKEKDFSDLFDALGLT